MRAFVFLLICLTACSSGERNVLISYECIDELPDYVRGTYVLANLVITDTKTDVTTELRPRAVTGKLQLGEDNSFRMKLREGKLVNNLVGYFDVNDHMLLVYTDRDSDDIVTVLHYRYSHKRITFTSYNGISKRRFISYWNQISTLTSGD
ncbi:MAG: hypothetical protein OXN17_08195 [Candidatus Poribacteria bacterium]|nr:hypothetical protein [Candidatus Poribacteria bacterium]MDE0505331.1 hypothetical protein [Candidatus Poribacteria bacterium]